MSAGEEGIAVGSAAALKLEDAIFAQYREAGVMKHRGFTLDDFMNQLFANRKDAGRGRNMPVHYGSGKLNIVRLLLQYILESALIQCLLLTKKFKAHYLLAPGNTDTAGGGRCLRTQNAIHAESHLTAAGCVRLLLW